MAGTVRLRVADGGLAMAAVRACSWVIGPAIYSAVPPTQSKILRTGSERRFAPGPVWGSKVPSGVGVHDAVVGSLHSGFVHRFQSYFCPSIARRSSDQHTKALSPKACVAGAFACASRARTELAAGTRWPRRTMGLRPARSTLFRILGRLPTSRRSPTRCVRSCVCGRINPEHMCWHQSRQGPVRAQGCCR
jgi:hypothetical protein